MLYKTSNFMLYILYYKKSNCNKIIILLTNIVSINKNEYFVKKVFLQKVKGIMVNRNSHCFLFNKHNVFSGVVALFC